MLHVEDGAIHIHAVGIGPVQYDKLLALLRAGIHQATHSNIIGVEAQPHILNVHHQHIYLLHGLGIGFSSLLAVERNDGQSCLRIHRVIHLLASIGLPSETMLWGEDIDDVEPTALQQVHHMLLTRHACLIGIHTYALALQEREVSLRAQVARKNLHERHLLFYRFLCRLCITASHKRQQNQEQKVSHGNFFNLLIL